MSETINTPLGVNADGCLPREFSKPNFRRANASKYLDYKFGIQIAPATLAKLACIGGGPAFFKSVRTPLYPREELDRWATERLGKLKTSTSQEDDE